MSGQAQQRATQTSTNSDPGVCLMPTSVRGPEFELPPMSMETPTLDAAAQQQEPAPLVDVNVTNAKDGPSFIDNLGNTVSEQLRNHSDRIQLHAMVNFPANGALEWGFGVKGFIGIDNQDRIEASLSVPLQGTLSLRLGILSGYFQFQTRPFIDVRAESAHELFDLVWYALYDIVDAIPSSSWWIDHLFDPNQVDAVVQDWEEGEYVAYGMAGSLAAGAHAYKQRGGDVPLTSGMTLDGRVEGTLMRRLEGQGGGQAPEATNYGQFTALGQMRPGEAGKRALGAVTGGRLGVDRLDVEYDATTPLDGQGPTIQANRYTVRLKVNPERRGLETPNYENLNALLRPALGLDVILQLFDENSAVRHLFRGEESRVEAALDAATSNTATVLLARLIAPLDKMPRTHRPGGQIFEAALYPTISVYDVREVRNGQTTKRDVRFRVELVVDFKHTFQDSLRNGRPDPQDRTYLNLMTFNRLVDISWTL
ncbi:MAG: hypothetical protein AAGA48_01725 [Myxococcota bacterium]